MKQTISLLIALVINLALYGQSKNITTGNNLISTSDPLSGDIIIGK